MQVRRSSSSATRWAWPAVLLVVASCTLGSDLDALEGGEGTGGGNTFDASFDGPLEGGKCVPGADCTGCEDCMAWCALDFQCGESSAALAEFRANSGV